MPIYSYNGYQFLVGDESRPLEDGEVIKVGDFYFEPDYLLVFKTIAKDSHCVGSQYTSKRYYPFFRKKEINNKISYSTEQLEGVLNKLKENRAFNADSAMLISLDNPEFHLYAQLEIEKKIQRYGLKFYAKT